MTRRRWQKRFRLRHGLCVTCGYDLTANTSGICPECGMATSKAADVTKAP
jgi:predicted amidophosphoribosyltransferase